MISQILIYAIFIALFAFDWDFNNLSLVNGKFRYTRRVIIRAIFATLFMWKGLEFMPITNIGNFIGGAIMMLTGSTICTLTYNTLQMNGTKFDLIRMRIRAIPLYISLTIVGTFWCMIFTYEIFFRIYTIIATT